MRKEKRGNHFAYTRIHVGITHLLSATVTTRLTESLRPEKEKLQHRLWCTKIVSEKLYNIILNFYLFSMM